MKREIQKELRFSLPIQKNYEDDGKWYIEALASTTEVDSENFRMTKPALEDLVKDALVLRTVLHNHLKDEEIGAVTEARVIQVRKEPEVWGAWVKILISKTVPDIWQKIREGVLNKLSIKGIAESRSVQDKSRGIIEEAVSYNGAEISIVSVPTLKTARILAHYVEKIKNGGLPMETKDLQKINMDSAKEAIRDLLQFEKDDEKWGEVAKILDLVEIEKESSDGGAEENQTDEEIENDWKSQMEKILTALKNLRDRVEEDKKKLVSDVIALVEAVVSAYPKYPTPRKYPAPQEKSEDDAKGGDAEESEVAPEKSRAIALALAEGLEKQLGELSEADRVPFAAVLSTLKKLSGSVEKERGEGEDGKTTENMVDAIEKTLKEVQKSVQDAASKIEHDRIVEMAEQVLTMKAEVGKLSEVLLKQVPLRKGLSAEGARRAEDSKPFIEEKEYLDLPPRDKLSVLFRKLKGE